MYSIDKLTTKQNKAYTKKSDEVKALKAKLEKARVEIKRLRDRPRFSIVIPASEIIITNTVDRVYKGYTHLYMRPDLGFLRGIDEATRSRLLGGQSAFTMLKFKAYAQI